VSIAEYAQRVFELVFAGCSEDPDCRAAFPDLRERFVSFLDGLSKQPAKVRLAHPATGAPVELTLTRDAFLLNLHGMLYVPEIAALLPLILSRAREGDFAPFVAQAYGSGALGRGLYHGMMFSVVCAEDAPRVTPAQLEGLKANTFLRDTYANSLREVCAFWPRGEPHREVKAPSSAPALLLSGELDPVTPPRRAEEARASLPAATHVVVPGAGHNTAGKGCVPRLVARFVEQGNAAGLPLDCVKTMARPPFFVSFAGPTP
jgi:pimeloyl-ACP methyl ester carboxylesterase